MHDLPIVECEATMIACLALCPTCRAWAKAMGITETAFGDSDRAMLAGWFMNGGHTDAPGAVEEALAKPLYPKGTDGLMRTVNDALEYYSHDSWMKDHGHLLTFQLAAQQTFYRWGKPTGLWALDRIAAGDRTVIKRAAELFAFMAHDIEHYGVWVYNPGEELRVKWPLEGNE